MKKIVTSMVLVLTLTACNRVEEQPEQTTTADYAPEPEAVVSNVPLMSEEELNASSENMMEQQAADKAEAIRELQESRRFTRKEAGEGIELIVDRQTGCELVVIQSTEYTANTAAKVPVVVPNTNASGSRICNKENKQ